MNGTIETTDKSRSSESALKLLLCVGSKYNWINQLERLVYLGENFSSNGYWHQFAKVESPETVWCEVLDSDLEMIEETKNTDEAREPVMCDLGTPLSKQQTSNVFHNLWSRCVGMQGYDKNAWKSVRDQLAAAGVDT